MIPANSEKQCLRKCEKKGDIVRKFRNECAFARNGSILWCGGVGNWM